jgi:hypothetical protein
MHLERDVLQGRDAAEFLGQMLDLEKRHSVLAQLRM